MLKQLQDELAKYQNLAYKKEQEINQYVQDKIKPIRDQLFPITNIRVLRPDLNGKIYLEARYNYHEELDTNIIIANELLENPEEFVKFIKELFKEKIEADKADKLRKYEKLKKELKLGLFQ